MEENLQKTQAKGVCGIERTTPSAEWFTKKGDILAKNTIDL
jgi:hypothetical protein